MMGGLRMGGANSPKQREEKDQACHLDGDNVNLFAQLVQPIHYFF
jgi:hypothetical protein